MDLDDLTLITSETKATYPKIKEYLLKKFRFKVSGLYIMQIKAKYVYIRKNYNKSKKKDFAVPQVF